MHLQKLVARWAQTVRGGRGLAAQTLGSPVRLGRLQEAETPWLPALLGSHGLQALPGECDACMCLGGV